MNERIKELAEQAKFMAEEDINKQISYNTELKAFAEKFAQLIIFDCVNAVMDGTKEGDHYAQKIEEQFSGAAVLHFGVEE